MWFPGERPSETPSASDGLSGLAQFNSSKKSDTLSANLTERAES